MPYEWIEPKKSAASPAPLAELHLWPYRSLLRRDFVVFIGATSALILVPMLAVLGSPVLWGILPFFGIALGGIWYALHRSYKDGEVIETLRIWKDRIMIDHHDPKRGRFGWEANPYWVELKIDRNHEKFKNYITLRGADREVELGAFLGEDERECLFSEVQEALQRLTKT